jgi:alpha,alpha-trehalase
MYQDDVNEAVNTNQAKDSFFQNLRAAAASGWDFSARWMDESARLSTIHTGDIVPVDLNCLLYFLESAIAKAKSMNNDGEAESYFLDRARQRKENILAFCWNENLGFFCDYNFRKKEINSFKSLAAVFPLYFNIASEEQASSVANIILSEFLKPGGVVITNVLSGQQWDSPNGWAPLQWITYQGLVNYGHTKLANEISQRWLSLNDKVFKDTGKMLEKYNVENIDLLSGGGEYPVQDGFGWTNGVYLKLLNTLK